MNLFREASGSVGKTQNKVLSLEKFFDYTSEVSQIRAEIIVKFVQITPALLHQLDRSISQRSVKATAEVLHKLKAPVLIFSNEAFCNDMVSMEELRTVLPTQEFLSRARDIHSKTAQLVDEIRNMS